MFQLFFPDKPVAEGVIAELSPLTPDYRTTTLFLQPPRPLLPEISVITTSLLASVLLSASPFVLADDHKDGPRDKPNMEKMCEQFKEGKGPFDRKERQEKREALQ